MSDFDQLNQHMTNFAIKVGQTIGTLQTSDKKTNDAVKLLNKAVVKLLKEVEGNSLSAATASAKASEALTQATNSNKAIGDISKLHGNFKQSDVTDLVSVGNHLMEQIILLKQTGGSVPSGVEDALIQINKKIKNLSDDVFAVNQQESTQNQKIKNLETKVGSKAIPSELGKDLSEAVVKLHETRSQGGGSNPPPRDFTADIEALRQDLQTTTATANKAKEDIASGFDLSGLSADYDNHKSSVKEALNHVMQEAKVKGGGNSNVDLAPINQKIGALETLTNLSGLSAGFNNNKGTVAQALNHVYEKATDTTGLDGLKQKITALEDKSEDYLPKSELTKLSSDYNNPDSLSKALNSVMTEAKNKGNVDLSSINNSIQALQQKDTSLENSMSTFSTAVNLSTLTSDYQGHNTSISTALNHVMTEAKNKGSSTDTKVTEIGVSTTGLGNAERKVFNGKSYPIHKYSLNITDSESNTISKKIYVPTLYGISQAPSDLTGSTDTGLVRQKFSSDYFYVNPETGEITSANGYFTYVHNQYIKEFKLEDKKIKLLTAVSNSKDNDDIERFRRTMEIDLSSIIPSSVSFEGATYISYEDAEIQHNGQSISVSNYGSIRTYKFKKASGEEVNIKTTHAHPTAIEYTASGNSGALATNQFNTKTFVVEANGEGNSTIPENFYIATASLEPLELVGTKLKVTLAHRQGGNNTSNQKIANADQVREIDLANLVEDVLSNVPMPTSDSHATNKKYVDDSVTSTLAAIRNMSPSPLVLVGRAQYATCRLAPFDGGGNSASKTKDVFKSSKTGDSITFTNELTFNTTQAGWYKITLNYSPGNSTGIFLNNGVSNFLDTTAPLIAGDAFPPNGFCEFFVRVEANKNYRTNLADKTSRQGTINNVHFSVQYVGDHPNG